MLSSNLTNRLYAHVVLFTRLFWRLFRDKETYSPVILAPEFVFDGFYFLDYHCIDSKTTISSSSSTSTSPTTKIGTFLYHPSSPYLSSYDGCISCFCTPSSLFHPPLSPSPPRHPSSTVGRGKSYESIYLYIWFLLPTEPPRVGGIEHNRNNS